MIPLVLGASVTLPACNGIFDGVYDEPPSEEEVRVTTSGHLYVDASDWCQWHYIDLDQVAANVVEDPEFNPSSLWQTFDIPEIADGEVSSENNPAFDESGLEKVSGIYTYWYDVFGVGLDNNHFSEYTPLDRQPEPQSWTIAVHRNNVRTNGGEVAATSYSDISDLPEGRKWLESLSYTPDVWNEMDVWTIQDRMLLGYIGNQGIRINETLSSWLRVDIPPMPPSFTHDGRVFILRLADGSYAALQLVNYQSPKGTKCCLTINYRYPL